MQQVAHARSRTNKLLCGLDCICCRRKKENLQVQQESESDASESEEHDLNDIEIEDEVYECMLLLFLYCSFFILNIDLLYIFKLD